MRIIKLLFIAVIAVSLISCKQQGKTNTEESEATEVQTTLEQAHNMLSQTEKNQGWVLLFDGVSTDGWHNWNEDKISGWNVEDGCLIGQGLGGDIGGDII